MRGKESDNGHEKEAFVGRMMGRDSNSKQQA